MRERQEGQYYGLGISIQVDRRRHHRDVDLRRVAGLQEGHPPRRRHRADRRRRTRRAGRASRRSSKLKGPEGHDGQHLASRRRGYDELIDLDVERDEVNIVTVRGAFMIDKDTGYIKLGDFAETSDDEVGAALKKLTDSGHEAAGVRPARQSRRPARPGDQDRQPVPARAAT